MNKTFLIGRLTKDPELRYTESNKAIANFTVAIDRQYTNSQGEKETDFINIVTFQKQAENVKKYVSKGSQVAVDGRIQTRNYEDKDGKRIYVTEVIADRVQFLDTKSVKEEKSLDDEVESSVKSGISDGVFSEFGTSIEIDESDLAF